MKGANMLLAAGLVFIATTSVRSQASSQQIVVVTEDNLNQALKSAKTPAEHEAIAVYYDTEAAENEKKAALHSSNKSMYSKLDFSAHCNALIRNYQQAAKQDKAFAALHRKMATKAPAQ